MIAVVIFHRSLLASGAGAVLSEPQPVIHNAADVNANAGIRFAIAGSAVNGDTAVYVAEEVCPMRAAARRSVIWSISQGLL